MVLQAFYMESIAYTNAMITSLPRGVCTMSGYIRLHIVTYKLKFYKKRDYRY